jgi:hypothetical protein
MDMDAGAIIILIALLVVMPVGILMSMVGLAGVLGAVLGHDRDLDNVTDDGEPNEYLALADSNPYESG